MTSGRRISSQGARANCDSRLPRATLSTTRHWVRSMLGVVVLFWSQLSDYWEGGRCVCACVCVSGAGGRVRACVSRGWETTVTGFCMRRIKSLRGGDT